MKVKLINTGETVDVPENEAKDLVKMGFGEIVLKTDRKTLGIEEDSKDNDNTKENK